MKNPVLSDLEALNKTSAHPSQCAIQLTKTVEAATLIPTDLDSIQVMLKRIEEQSKNVLMLQILQGLQNEMKDMKKAMEETKKEMRVEIQQAKEGMETVIKETMTKMEEIEKEMRQTVAQTEKEMANKIEETKKEIQAEVQLIKKSEQMARKVMIQTIKETKNEVQHENQKATKENQQTQKDLNSEMQRMAMKLPQMNAIQHKLEKQRNDIKAIQQSTKETIGGLKVELQTQNMAM
ncbi:hypothetical protein GLAREA_09404 [Glarea lozoyensis ATCC 20868]|uniref:Uncharacterized protein n=2 Tax=Glarea lozoyensis TaxID=101852 RepID=S3CTD9_GLAL2|nr:uncharacterized protein GLAREA_09404 [Glarea lozoyensis ATCC 20868]EHK99700.1 hypothetical protein M7I_4377 [Glarea lozoyensis 74030]EPE28284.1 hypothetical protein GLAREA_09404 [Glarea lozoyensis ATCC 20868]